MPEFGEVDLTACMAKGSKDATLEDYGKAFDYAAAAQRYSPFWLGDLANQITDRWGDAGMQAMPEGVSWDLVQRCSWVCAIIPPAQRHPGLSFSHHREAARLRDQPQLIPGTLQMASEQAWTSGEIRQHVSNLLRNMGPDSPFVDREEL